MNNRKQDPIHERNPSGQRGQIPQFPEIQRERTTRRALDGERGRGPMPAKPGPDDGGQRNRNLGTYPGENPPSSSDGDRADSSGGAAPSHPSDRAEGPEKAGNKKPARSS
jgi:hypothetical protein